MTKSISHASLSTHIIQTRLIIEVFFYSQEFLEYELPQPNTVDYYLNGEWTDPKSNLQVDSTTIIL